MSYHTILRTSSDYTAALKHSRVMSKNISKTIGGKDVFAYSVFYVFYEQYLTIVKDTELPNIVKPLPVRIVMGRTF